jgi:hypothetical protein
VGGAIAVLQLLRSKRSIWPSSAAALTANFDHLPFRNHSSDQNKFVMGNYITDTNNCNKMAEVGWVGLSVRLTNQDWIPNYDAATEKTVPFISLTG